MLTSELIALMWGAYCVGMLCSLFAYIYLRCKFVLLLETIQSLTMKSLISATHPSYNVDGQYTAPVIMFAFLIGLQACKLLKNSGLIHFGAHAYHDSVHTFICHWSWSINNVSRKLILLAIDQGYWQLAFSIRFVGLGEDPGVLAIRAPELFGVCIPSSYWLYNK